ncbi:MAG: dihydroorotate dehydrogenase [bacterium]
MFKPDLSVKIGNIALKNPVMPASGTFGIEYEKIVPIDKLGAIITKGITLKPKEGNKPPRILETPSGLLNSIGLENPGVEAFLKDILPQLKKYNIPIIANIAGETIKEYEELGEILEKEVSGIEVNISCPNVSKGGIEFGQEPKVVFSLVARIRKRTSLTMIAKLSPNVSEIKPIAKACSDAGADAISLINTIKGLAIDIERQRPVFERKIAGLSGPCIKPIALRMVWEAYNAVSIPIIGIGGISKADDAIEFFLAGARAIEVGSIHFIDPLASIKIIDGIRGYMKKRKISNLHFFKKKRDEIGRGETLSFFNP